VTGASSTPVIRPAVPADAEPLVHCHLACWREAYTGMVDPERLRLVLSDVADRVERWRHILVEFPGRLLAEHDGEVVGLAAAGPNRDAELGLRTELYALYIRQAWWGSGLGHRLLEAAIGDADASLWVFRENARARRSYTRHGFVPDGAEKHDDYFGGAEIRMVRRGYGRPAPDVGARRAPAGS